MKTGSGEQPVVSTRPKLQADFSEVVAWLKAKPGKRIVVGRGLSCRSHRAREARTISIRGRAT